MRAKGSLMLALILLAAVAVILRTGQRTDAAPSPLPNKVSVLMLARDEFPTPTVTPTTPPTAVPTAPPPTSAPTTAPTGIQFSGVTSYTDSIEYHHIIGLVVNYLPYNAEFVEIQSRYYSANGTLLDTGFTYARRSVVPRGEASPFEVSSRIPAGATRWEVEVVDWSQQNFYALPTGLVPTITNTFVDTIDYGHIVGTVRNTSSVPWKFTEVHLALLRGSQIVDVDFTFTKPSDLAPGQTGTFEALISPHSGLDPVSFTGVQILIWVDADD